MEVVPGWCCMGVRSGIQFSLLVYVNMQFILCICWCLVHLLFLFTKREGVGKASQFDGLC